MDAPPTGYRTPIEAAMPWLQARRGKTSLGHGA